MVADGALQPDPHQRAAIAVLDEIATKLQQRPKPGLLDRLFAPRPEPVRGAYLVGDVGRGKTLLMDLFFSLAPEPKRRVHFHEFMDEIHAGIAAFRQSEQGQAEDADPIAAVTRPLLKQVRLLCLDEFHVNDITNAMLLGRLFERLFAGGVVLVATSNVPPERLYENGLNRQLFLPFIALLKRHASIVSLDGPIDYRRLKFEGQEVYAFGTGSEARAAMDRLWSRLTGGAEARPAVVESLGRKLTVPLAAMGAARFPASELIEKPLGARDYLRLSHAFDSFVLDDVPQFTRLRSDAAKRFILLIDTLYDRGLKLGASFAVPLEQLGGDEATRFEFARTVSRLIEMQSADYLSAPRKAPAAA